MNDSNPIAKRASFAALTSECIVKFNFYPESILALWDISMGSDRLTRDRAEFLSPVAETSVLDHSNLGKATLKTFSAAGWHSGIVCN